ncbi:DUF3397 domain-containing protein [Saccharibacillus kuerlensis]|uniref:DUF3397 domain-containing protein n=1 Tax=Saccharibacillus kuerlensis TaxID=459527 RepID=A0ABQ2KXX8_9BACL|nr:DUF3397 domain-containing protein [Saccharibacillus kuerlensis]GGN96592.1 hypothetical protein GCM10010969_13760 [Saccharibacillus kuerlensis]
MFATVSGVLITLCVLPFLPFLLVYAVGVLCKEPRPQSFRRAMDVTTPFLIFAVSALYNYVLGSTFGFYLLLLILLILAGLLGSAQNRKRGKIEPRRLVSGFWRMTFLFLAPCYILLGISGFIAYLINI